ncbi:MAG TPA: HIT family protein [Saprospiraceae bacterium]|nr:HIT family protein [Saprospiraceae bacterium]HZV44113.1 HIT family protein [Saprospiraceae bacterium]
MASVFTKIINGEIPSHKVAENERCFAFLDIRPVVFGHTLVVPKKEVDYYFDLEDDYLAEMNQFAKRVAAVLRQEVDCLRIGVMIAGLEVPHAHIHLIPMNSIGELSFTNPRPTFPSDEMAALADRLSKAYQSSYK